MSSPTIKIFPSLLACNMAEFQKEVDSVSPFVDGIHYDVMDGNFVPNISFGASILKNLSTSTPLGFDAHLMVSHPDIFLEDFAKAGAKSVSVHFETCPHIHRTLDHITQLGMISGVALNPGTSYESAYEAIKKANFVLVMSVNPGFGGQKFLPETLEKIQKIRKNFPQKNIQVDGGITDKTAPMVIEAGANWLVSGSFIFSSNNKKKAVESLIS